MIYVNKVMIDLMICVYRMMKMIRHLGSDVSKYFVLKEPCNY